MKTLTTLVLLFSLYIQTTKAQNVDEIIEKHVSTMGGSQKLQSLSTVLLTGTFTATGDTTPIAIIVSKKNNVGSRIDITANNTNNYQVINHKGGWIFTPVQGDKEPRPLAQDQFKAAEVQLDLQGPFINSKEKGIKIVKLADEEVAGAKCYQLKVTFPNTNVTVYFIDSKTNLIVKTTTKLFQFGALEDVATFYSHYKQNNDGYWFAYQNQTPRGKTIYQEINTNLPIEDNLFKTK